MAAAVFAGLAVVVITPRLNSNAAVVALWAALAPLLVVLVQAGGYWLLARRWVGVATMPGWLAGTFRAFRVIDLVLLAAGLIGLALSARGGATFFVVIWAFGLLEYLNYFVVRLAYPPGQWFARVTQRRIPQLLKDVASARG